MINKPIKCRIYSQLVYNNKFCEYWAKHYLAKTTKDNDNDDTIFYLYDSKLKESILYSWYLNKASIFELEEAVSIIAHFYKNGENRIVNDDGEEEIYYFGLEII